MLCMQNCNGYDDAGIDKVEQGRVHQHQWQRTAVLQQRCADVVRPCASQLWSVLTWTARTAAAAGAAAHKESAKLFLCSLGGTGSIADLEHPVLV